MRSAVLDYIKKLGLTGFNLSTELPYDENGVPLYLKNVRRIYVESPQTSTEPAISTLGGGSIYNETTTFNIYFAADAKNSPANFDATIAKLKGTANIPELGWFQTRETDVETTYETDLSVTRLEVRLTRLI